LSTLGTHARGAGTHGASAQATRVWLNGQLVRAHEASVSVFDRGFLFGDGVYELVRFFGGRPVGMDLHVARLERSLELARIHGFDAHSFPSICDSLMRDAGLADASVYLQVTRGAAPTRTHLPPAGLTPTVFAYAMPCAGMDELGTLHRCAAGLVPDRRWDMCEIKTVALMGNILGMLDAHARGGEEAIFHRNGLVSEGGSTNVFIVKDGCVVTPPVESDPPMLHGVMRARLIEACVDAGIRCTVRPIPIDELRSADEVLLTASKRMLSSVESLDGATVPGARSASALAPRLLAALRARIARECAPVSSTA
jgi:D-alanine transaminase